MEGPKIHFSFDQGEYIALCELALKYKTDLGGILKIGGRLVLEADRRGLLKISTAGDATAALLPGKPS